MGAVGGEGDDVDSVDVGERAAQIVDGGCETISVGSAEVEEGELVELRIA